MAVFASSGAFCTKSMAEVVSAAAAHGINRVEFSSGMDWTPDVDGLLQRAKDAGIEFLLHNYFPAPKEPFVLNLGSTDEDVRRRSLEHCKELLGMCAHWDVPFYSVHSGFAIHAKPSQLGQDLRDAPRASLEETRGRFIDSLKELCETTASLGVKLAIENNVIAGFNLIDGKNLLALAARPEEVQSVLEEIASPDLGLLFDVAHAKVSGAALGFEPAGFFDLPAERIIGFHLSDNDGTRDSNEPLTADSWFLGRLAQFRDKPMVLESYDLDRDAILANLALIENSISSGSPIG